MAIEKVKCKQCNKVFHGTARAMFCSSKCKQKNYRENSQARPVKAELLQE